MKLLILFSIFVISHCQEIDVTQAPTNGFKLQVVTNSPFTPGVAYETSTGETISNVASTTVNNPQSSNDEYPDRTEKEINANATSMGINTEGSNVLSVNTTTPVNINSTSVNNEATAIVNPIENTNTLIQHLNPVHGNFLPNPHLNHHQIMPIYSQFHRPIFSRYNPHFNPTINLIPVENIPQQQPNPFPTYQPINPTFALTGINSFMNIPNTHYQGHTSHVVTPQKNNDQKEEKTDKVDQTADNKNATNVNTNDAKLDIPNVGVIYENPLNINQDPAINIQPGFHRTFRTFGNPIYNFVNGIPPETVYHQPYNHFGPYFIGQNFHPVNLQPENGIAGNEQPQQEVSTAAPENMKTEEIQNPQTSNTQNSDAKNDNNNNETSKPA